MTSVSLLKYMNNFICTAYIRILYFVFECFAWTCFARIAPTQRHKFSGPAADRRSTPISHPHTLFTRTEYAWKAPHSQAPASLEAASKNGEKHLASVTYTIALSRTSKQENTIMWLLWWLLLPPSVNRALTYIIVITLHDSYLAISQTVLRSCSEQRKRNAASANTHADDFTHYKHYANDTMQSATFLRTFTHWAW